MLSREDEQILTPLTCEKILSKVPSALEKRAARLVDPLFDGSHPEEGELSSAVSRSPSPRPHAMHVHGRSHLSMDTTPKSLFDDSSNSNNSINHDDDQSAKSFSSASTPKLSPTRFTSLHTPKRTISPSTVLTSKQRRKQRRTVPAHVARSSAIAALLSPTTSPTTATAQSNTKPGVLFSFDLQHDTINVQQRSFARTFTSKPLPQKSNGSNSSNTTTSLVTGSNKASSARNNSNTTTATASMKTSNKGNSNTRKAVVDPGMEEFRHMLELKKPRAAVRTTPTSSSTSTFASPSHFRAYAQQPSAMGNRVDAFVSNMLEQPKNMPSNYSNISNSSFANTPHHSNHSQRQQQQQSHQLATATSNASYVSYPFANNMGVPQQPRRKLKQCACCKTTNTPLWRDKGPSLPMCNACGIRFNKYGRICSKCHYVPCKQERELKHCKRCGA